MSKQNKKAKKDSHLSVYKELEQIRVKNIAQHKILKAEETKKDSHLSVYKDLEQMKAKSIAQQKAFEAGGTEPEKRKKVIEAMNKELAEKMQKRNDDAFDKLIGDFLKKTHDPVSVLNDLSIINSAIDEVLKESGKTNSEIEPKSYSNLIDGKPIGVTIPLLIGDDEGLREDQGDTITREPNAKALPEKQPSELPQHSSPNDKLAEEVSHTDNFILMQAIATGNVDLVRSLLKSEYVDINKMDRVGRTPLMAAVDNKRIEIVKILLADPNIDPNIEDDILGKTALMYAVINDQAEVVEELLVNEKVDPNKKDARMVGCTPLIYATILKRYNIVNIFLANKRVDLNIKWDQQGRTPLGLAIIQKELELIKIFLASNRINLDVKDDFGMTVLAMAVIYRFTNIVTKLLVAGANPNVGIMYNDEDGWNALMIAASKGYCDIVEMLIKDQNINLNAQTASGETALIMAACNNHVNVVKALLANPKVDPNIKWAIQEQGNANMKFEPLGQTALICAAERNHIEVIKVLLENPRVNPNIKSDLFSRTALMHAIMHNKLEATKTLLASSRVDPNVVSDVGETALVYAIAYGKSIEIIKALLANQNVDTNIQDENGMTALMQAVRNNNLNVVAMLFMHPKVNFDIKNKEGKTAFDLAKTDEIKNFFSKH